MKISVRCFPLLILCIVFLTVTNMSVSAYSQQARQTPSALKTPLSQDILTLLANEISGQIIFNNEVILAGAPWIRSEQELSSTFYEAQKIYDIARDYGIKTADLVHHARDREFAYPLAGEFWIIEPEERLVARLEADAALIAGSSDNVDLTGTLIYIPPLNAKQIKEWKEAGPQEQYQGKIALMWSQAYRNVAEALDAAGIQGVISFNTRERYFDPDQVVYSRGSYQDKKNLKFGFAISWRQWSELLEDVERGRKIKVRCKTKINQYQDRFDTVFCWIPGTEPDKKGVIFSAHLFEGYTKRGANDNMSGCVVQLEILRALTRLIGQGALPQPRRNIYFLWPNEISGTYEYIKQNPSLVDKLSTNINMDMVGEALRKNNALFTMTECPNYLPSYLDAAGDAIMNYVWRTNDIVYLPDSPRGRPGGQYFPRPMWEKNGSKDAFRYYTHLATGGSDHICFNNSSVGVPGIELNIWPDQWYHADTDTPDKSDPTQLKRTAFIGAAMAWAAAHCTDDVLDDLLASISAFGYARIGKRELPKAMGYLENAKEKNLQEKTDKAFHLINLAVQREIGAITSTQDIFTGSEKANSQIRNYTQQWQLYQQGLQSQIINYAKVKAKQLQVPAPQKPELTAQQQKHRQTIPAIHSDVKGRQFSLENSENYKKYLEENQDAIKELGLNYPQRRAILNYINGKRSLTDIYFFVIAETEKPIKFDSYLKYINILESVNWITL